MRFAPFDVVSWRYGANFGLWRACCVARHGNAPYTATLSRRALGSHLSNLSPSPVLHPVIASDLPHQARVSQHPDQAVPGSQAAVAPSADPVWVSLAALRVLPAQTAVSTCSYDDD